MRIPIAKIRNNNTLNIEEQIDIKDLGENAKLVKPLVLKGSLKYAGSEEIYFEGALYAEVELVCVRCLNTFVQKFEINFSETYIPESFVTNQPREKDMDLEELDVYTYGGNILDTSNIAREILIQHIPPYPICPICRAKENNI